MDNTKFYQCWKYIEKIAFTPGFREADIRLWLDRFVRFFFKTFYGAENYFPNTFDRRENKFTKEFTFERIYTKFKFIINPGISSFSFQLKWEKSSDDKPNLHYEYDSKFRCEWDYLYHEPKKSQKNPDFNKSELEDILRNIIDHPAVHCHILNELWRKSLLAYDNDIDIHEIRLGMPTTNPFLFLYQVTFQFLSIIGEQKKQEELKRLTKVLWENKNKMPISAGVLFSLK